MSAQPTGPTLIHNLRSRKLPQWLLAYAAGAWVLLQVLSLQEVDVATIARTLGVANVLEGSVRKSGNTLRITPS